MNEPKTAEEFATAAHFTLHEHEEVDLFRQAMLQGYRQACDEILSLDADPTGKDVDRLRQIKKLEDF